jgi:hypothetical protein
MNGMTEVLSIDTLRAAGERAGSLQLEADISLAQWNNLEGFLEHERQEIDTLAELAAVLETHHEAMTELATALALVRQQLFGEIER